MAEQMTTDVAMGHCSVYGINGEWLEEAEMKNMKLGDTVKIELTVYVKEKGRTLLDPSEKASREFVKFQTSGVKVSG